MPTEYIGKSTRKRQDNLKDKIVETQLRWLGQVRFMIGEITYYKKNIQNTSARNGQKRRPERRVTNLQKKKSRRTASSGNVLRKRRMTERNGEKNFK